MDTPLERAYTALNNIQRLNCEMQVLSQEYARLRELKDLILNSKNYEHAEGSTTCRRLSAEDTLFGHDEYDYEEYRTRHEASGRDRVHA